MKTASLRGFGSAYDLRIEIGIEAPNLTRFGDANYAKKKCLHVARRFAVDRHPAEIEYRIEL